VAEFPNQATQFQPGQSGNPGGSSKKQRLTARLNKLLGEMAEEDFIEAGIRAAKSGEFNFWKYIYERIDGPMPEAEPQLDITMEAIAALEQVGNPDDSSEGSTGAGPVSE
jgi:hypothetical protein